MNKVGSAPDMLPEYDFGGGVRSKYVKRYGEGTNVRKGVTDMAERDTYKYVFKVGNKIVHRGITDDLKRREQEHRAKWPNGHIVRVGRRTTQEAARRWEEEQGCS